MTSMQAVDVGTRILPSIARGVKLAFICTRSQAKIVLSEMVTIDSVQNTPQPPQVRGVLHFHCRFIFPPVNVFPIVMRNVVYDNHGNEIVD